MRKMLYFQWIKYINFSLLIAIMQYRFPTHYVIYTIVVVAIVVLTMEVLVVAIVVLEMIVVVVVAIVELAVVV